MSFPLGPATLALALVATMAGCASPAPADEAGPAVTTPACGEWGCEQQARLDAAAALVASQPGQLSIEVIDRQTGATWTAGDATLRTWAGSTPKLALTVVLLEADAAGTISLDDDDWDAIDAMLSVSDNEAADRLWDGYVEDSDTIMGVWRDRFGMTSATFVDGWPDRWGFVKLTAADLTSLVDYILTRLAPEQREFLVGRMRTVGEPQHWGVWGAGADLQPGVKDGWDYCTEIGATDYRWVTATVGFAGPDERFEVAALFDGQPDDPLDTGVHALTDVVATIFGAPVPAPAFVPSDY